MTEPAKCQLCGTSLNPDAVDGLCPVCLLRQGLDIIAEESKAQEAPARQHQDKEDKPSQRVFGDYEIIQMIAQGGMGIVYKAKQISLNRVVALKMIRSGQLATPAEVQRFQTEATAAAQLDHPNIVPIYEIGECDGHYFYSMKYVEGDNLSTVIGRRPMDLKKAACILSKIARAVHYAHQHGVLHRDLKPTNILIDKNGEPQLTDFGLAKFLGQKENLTQSNAVMGSANYMSPEQAEGKISEVSVASDVYSLGAILYEMLTGKPPFEGESFVDTLRKVIEKDPIPPSTLNPRVDIDLETICLKCLDKQPANRYSSAEELANELESWMDGRPIKARPITRMQRLIKWAKRRPAIAGLLLLLFIVAAIGIGGIFWQWREAVSARKFAEQKALDAAQQAKIANDTAQALRLSLYAADINLAQRALLENNRGRAVELIRKHIPAKGQKDLRGFEWRYLYNLTRGDEQSSFQHNDFVESALLSPDNSKVITTDRSPFIYIWDIKQNKIIARLGELDSPVVRGTMFFTKNPLYLVVQTALSVYLFNLTNWTQVAQLQRAHLPLFFIQNGQYVAVKSFVIGILYFETETWEPRDLPDNQFMDLGTFRGVSPDGSFFITSIEDDQIEHIQFWDYTGNLIKVITCHIENPTYMAVSVDAKYLSAGDSRGYVKLWDANSGNELHSWQAHDSTIGALNFSYDSRVLATAGFDQTIKLWEIPTRRLLATLNGHYNEVWSIWFSRDNKWLVSGSKDSTAKLWRAEAKNEDKTLQNAMTPLGFSPDGSKIITLDFDKKLRLRNVNSRQIISELNIPTAEIAEGASIAVSKDLTLCAIGMRNGDAVVFDIKSASKLNVIPAHIEPITWITISEDNQKLATATSQQIAVWDLKSTKRIFDAGNCSGPIAFSKDGKYLAATLQDYSGIVWDVATGKQVAKLIGHRWTIWAVKFTDDAERLITAGMDGTARVWETKTGRQLAVLTGHKEVIPAIDISPDGRTLVTGSADDTVKLWSMDTYQELITITEFGEDVGSALFSPDGTTLAVGCFPGGGGRQPVQLWRAPFPENLSDNGLR